MKYFMSLIFSLAIYAQSLADCSSSGIWTYPNGGEINQNSLIVVEGYARSQSIIDSLNTRHKAYLEADGHKIDLKVIEICKGMFSLTQALLQPSTELLAGKTYVLKISNLNEWEKKGLMRWNSESYEHEPITWKASNKTNNQAPTWVTKPKFIDKTIEYFGCGPAVFTNYSMSVIDHSKTLIKTELYNITTQTSNSYYLTLKDNGTLDVGHGMCAGAFEYIKKHKYKIRFSLKSTSGNLSSLWTDWILFDSPYEDFKR